LEVGRLGDAAFWYIRYVFAWFPKYDAVCFSGFVKIHKYTNKDRFLAQPLMVASRACMIYSYTDAETSGQGRIRWFPFGSRFDQVFLHALHL
jgi:hypothetical protein